MVGCAHCCLTYLRPNFITIDFSTVSKQQLEIHFFHSSPAPVCLALFCKVPRSHSDTPHSAGLLWTSDQFVAETSTCTTHNTRNRLTSMSHVGFEPALPASKRPQTHALDRAAIRVGQIHFAVTKFHNHFLIPTADNFDVFLSVSVGNYSITQTPALRTLSVGTHGN